jgi:hypothetical protein
LIGDINGTLNDIHTKFPLTCHSGERKLSGACGLSSFPLSVEMANKCLPETRDVDCHHLN